MVAQHHDIAACHVVWWQLSLSRGSHVARSGFNQLASCFRYKCDNVGHLEDEGGPCFALLVAPSLGFLKHLELLGAHDYSPLQGYVVE